MTSPSFNSVNIRTLAVCLLFAASLLCGSSNIYAQCPGSTLTGGLLGPSKLVQSDAGYLIVAETGTSVPNSGRVSIVGRDGGRRTLLEGLPSGMNSNGDFAGTQGVFFQGRTLYVLNGEGNATLPGPIPGTELPNPNPNSPIMSSVLRVQFSRNAEKYATGFALTLLDHQALKNGTKLTFGNGRDRITVELVADFPDYVSDPLPFFAPNVRHSNPFGLVVVGDRRLYVSDGGRNAVLKVDTGSGEFSVLTAFPPISNPLFPGFGPPVIEAVPDNVREFDGQLLVTLLRGFPFLAGNSVVMSVDPVTGTATPFITGLTSAIDVLPVKTGGVTSFLTLEVSTDLLTGAPGRLQRFPTPAGPGVVISNCLIGPSNMERDVKTSTLYITEIFTGRIIKIPGL